MSATRAPSAADRAPATSPSPAGSLPGRLVRRLSLGLLGVLLSLLVMEGALQVVQPIPSEQLLPLPFHERRLRRLVKGEAYVTYDQELGWVTTPGIRQRVDGNLYRHNEAGIRAEREYDPTPSPGVLRIAAFGDSFTYCHEANFNDCWIEQLEELWSGSEVLNFGVPGYGPDQAWLRYQREGRAHTPSVVLIGYMAENINRVVNRYRPSLAPITDLLATKPRFLLDGDVLRLLENPATSPDLLSDPRWAEEAAREYDRWYFPNVFIESPMDRFELGRVARTAAYRYHRGDPDVEGMQQAYRPGDEAFEIVGRVLIEHARQVARDGSQPVVVIFNPAVEIEAALNGQTPAVTPLLAWLERENIPTIDVTPDLVSEARSAGVDAIIKHHYTPRGNRVVAQALARELPSRISERRAAVAPPTAAQPAASRQP